VPQTDLRAEVTSSFEEVLALPGFTAESWNALTGSDDPFCEWEFLTALESGGSIGPDTTWHPRCHLIYDGSRLVGAAALFIKYDSYGEFIFDWGWAEAYQRSGLPYYPKGIVAAPFTPVCGDRLLVHPDANYEAVAGALFDALRETAVREKLSGLHVLFCGQREHEFLTSRGMLPRLNYQYHWENRGYSTFEDYVGDLRSKKRKQVLREREEVRASGLRVEVVLGTEVRERELEALWSFYLDTHRRNGSDGYLSRRSFELLFEQMAHRLVLVVAYDGENPVAGTINMRKGRRLLGRYWGSSTFVPGLHFECCFYRLIEYAIDEGLELFEAGAQGEHKFLRGFAARPTYSAHWLAHPGGARAVGDFLKQERGANDETISRYNAVSPLKPLRAETRAALEERQESAVTGELDSPDSQ
jgi:predicted N-acyltransferase